MDAFSAAELAELRDAQVSAMMDTCELLKRTEAGQDEYGMPVEQWVILSVVACGLDVRGSREAVEGGGRRLFDARLRLPIGTNITGMDRLRVTKRHGELMVEQIMYEAVGDARRGSSGLILELRSVA
jgi:head-tail adaptor